MSPADATPVVGGRPPTSDPAAVVIADDDPAIRGLVAAAVRKAGATVIAEVGDGLAAVDAIRRYRPQLAILDVSMPAMDGVEACRQVRSDGDFDRLPIVMLSAAVHAAAVRAGLDAGADLYLEKPFSPRALAEQIRELLAARTVR